MEEPSHVRAVSLVLAFSIVVGGWLLFEYSNRSEPIITPPTEKSPDQAATPVAPLPTDLTFTYKCEKAGRLSYSDKPCNTNEKALAVTATEKEAPRTNNDLERLKQTVASMKASRLAREKRYATAANSVGTSTSVQSHEFRCQQIDKAIAAKDSELRQPHSAQWGDYLTGERKKLTDERFSLRC